MPAVMVRKKKPVCLCPFVLFLLNRHRTKHFGPTEKVVYLHVKKIIKQASSYGCFYVHTCPCTSSFSISDFHHCLCTLVFLSG